MYGSPTPKKPPGPTYACASDNTTSSSGRNYELGLLLNSSEVTGNSLNVTYAEDAEFRLDIFFFAIRHNEICNSFILLR